jgi:hypothetical protein
MVGRVVQIPKRVIGGLNNAIEGAAGIAGLAVNNGIELQQGHAGLVALNIYPLACHLCAAYGGIVLCQQPVGYMLVGYFVTRSPERDVAFSLPTDTLVRQMPRNIPATAQARGETLLGNKPIPNNQSAIINHQCGLCLLFALQEHQHIKSTGKRPVLRP